MHPGNGRTLGISDVKPRFCLSDPPHTPPLQDSGQHLSVIDDCNDHMLTVWDWQKKSKIAEIKVIKEGFSSTKYKVKLDAMFSLVVTGALSDH